MSSNRPFLIVETGQPVPSMRRHGGFPHWIRVAAGLSERDAVVVDVERGAALPGTDAYAGVIVTGSGAMVTERADWSERSADWLRDAAHAGVPVFGICYGHQLIAHALGGEVGTNPRGREMGSFEIETTAAAGDDPLFAGAGPRFVAQTTHLQGVLRLPEGATLLAQSALEPHHAFRWRDRVWGVQFHPEFSATHMRGYIRARSAAVPGRPRSGRTGRGRAGCPGGAGGVAAIRQVGGRADARLILSPSCPRRRASMDVAPHWLCGVAALPLPCRCCWPLPLLRSCFRR